MGISTGPFGGVVPINTVTGYSAADLNLDGVVHCTGQDNDRDLVLISICRVVPTNIRVEQIVS